MEHSMKRFSDRHVIVTGAATGIGRGIAQRFAEEGARVVIACRNSTNGERAARDLCDRGGTACYIQADVAKQESISALLKQAAEKYGPVDIAVSNAGIAEQQSTALDITPEEWDRVYGVNVRGSFFFCRACAQNMMDNGTQGSIITISSIMGRGAKGMTGAYASSKSSIIMFTKTLAKCLAPMGIRVNCVAPGVVATEIYNSVEHEYQMDQGEFANWLIEESVNSGQLLIPRIGTSEDIAGAVAFLASSDASYITAQTLSVDGGTDWCW